MSEERPRHAWEIDREIRLSAVPLDRRKYESSWYDSETVFPTGDQLIALFWKAKVPGSGAPEIPYVEMVQAMANRGYDMSATEALLPEGLRLAESGSPGELRALTSRLLHEIHAAPPDRTHSYWSYRHPDRWEEVELAMPAARRGDPGRLMPRLDRLEERIHSAWTGQLAGGAFGTAIEGYHTDRISEVYGSIDSYITAPETVNDDVVYELVLLDLFERSGRELSSRELALEWVRQIPFGWSAEWVALHNLADGILPPESGRHRNPYSNWIGAQMRGMVCGLLAPGWPLEAARLAHIDGVISHSANGVYGEIFAAVLTALAFVIDDPREILSQAAEFVPEGSEYDAVVREALSAVAEASSPEAAWRKLDGRFERYNWIHAYPNIAAVILSLWHGGGDMSESFRLLAHAGLDVDCNAGLVGTVLGLIAPVPEKWSAPLGDTLETYLKGKERIPISQLSARTAELVRSTW
ncbi:ADP-ribosylglycohydrolase family protein [Salinispira pacifica]